LGDGFLAAGVVASTLGEAMKERCEGSAASAGGGSGADEDGDDGREGDSGDRAGCRRAVGSFEAAGQRAEGAAGGSGGGWQVGRGLCGRGFGHRASDPGPTGGIRGCFEVAAAGAARRWGAAGEGTGWLGDQRSLALEGSVRSRSGVLRADNEGPARLLGDLSGPLLVSRERAHEFEQGGARARR
jgi:hypothetical protein